MPTDSRIVAAIRAAYAADEAYEAAHQAAGYKSRWDVPADVKQAPGALHDALEAKVKADRAMHAAFELARRSAVT